MRLNVGCGDYLLEGFVNLDADPATPADVHADAMVYLRDCPDATFAEVYAGHFLEHLTPEGAQRFLAECYRVLAPGGVRHRRAGYLRGVAPLRGAARRMRAD